MNNLENKEILSDKILFAMEKIKLAYPNIVFGGSISLNGVGVINRAVSDIDVFVSSSSPIPTKLIELGHEHGEIGSDTVTDVNGVNIQRTGMKIDYIKVCVFKVPEDELFFSLVKIIRDGINYDFKLQHVNHAINAKRSYQTKNPKHKEDLQSIDDSLNELFF